MTTPTPATSVQDPYGGSSGDGISFKNTSPDPGAPTDGMSSMMRLYVPADNTWMELGATSPAGIRAHANTHIGLTADTPATTVELGTPTGGLHIDTAGHKKEHITLLVEENYDATKTETVGQALTEIYKNTKTETVTLKVTENYLDQKEENITGPLTMKVSNATTNHYLSTLTEDVGGAWTVAPVKGDIKFDTTGSFKVHATGTVDMHGDADHKWLQVGSLKHLLLDAAFKLVIGMDTSINIGVKNDLRIAVHNDLRIGAHIDTKLAVLVQTALGPKLWGGTLFNGKDLIHSALTGVIFNTKTPVGMFKAAMWLDSAAMRILK
jgi:hypothetical protein